MNGISTEIHLNGTTGRSIQLNQGHTIGKCMQSSIQNLPYHILSKVGYQGCQQRSLFRCKISGKGIKTGQFHQKGQPEIVRLVRHWHDQAYIGYPQDSQLWYQASVTTVHYVMVESGSTVKGGDPYGQSCIN